ncbi:acyl-CoA dehydrogenase [Ornithinimicrobium avium]|uniref:Acyl-[acyl-carrier-protein] dehydrogenase MbtN n=2 Tax=Ornithinimicrobium avium TaxID=2283195 RepID=A0A345NSG5_9MICO|nr:acyl-CoA dehydrogenase [Ornithinimicrobium avium]
MLAPAPYRSPWMTEDLDDVRALARTFFERELTPHVDRWSKAGAVDREFWNRAGEAGLLCMSIPEEYGGGGGTFAHEAVIAEEQARAVDDGWGSQVHSAIVAHYILAYGTEEQKQRWLPGMASGELVGAIAMTEPGAGSDLQALRTSASLDGEHYVVDGSKTFVSNGLHADLVVIVVRTGGEGGRGLSLIVAETTDLPGFSRGRQLEKVGLKYQDTMELFFEDMRVPADNVLGGEAGLGRGFVQLMQQLGQERLIIAVTAVAAAETAVRLAVDYAKEREAFGRPILAFQNLRFELAECTTEALATRTLVDHCIGLHLQGRLDPATASMAKYFATDKQCELIDRALQVFGGYGFMTEYPIARMYASARVQKIYGGTNEIMKELIGRSL